VGSLSKYYIDANAVIALLESTLGLTVAQRAFLQSVDAGHNLLCSSHLTLAECLVHPIRFKDDVGMEEYSSFFEENEFIQTYDLDKQTFIDAAHFRVELGCKLPDALHVAIAVQYDCSYFITNDLKLRLPAGLERLVWNSFSL
jgi:predicted nucleic acid-binding protein